MGLCILYFRCLKPKVGMKIYRLPLSLFGSILCAFLFYLLPLACFLLWLQCHADRKYSTYTVSIIS